MPEMPDQSIRVEFAEKVWRDLFIVEFGLREALGDDAYVLEKRDDRLTVTFRSREDLQKGLETVVAQLAAQEQTKPGSVDALKLKDSDETVDVRERSCAGCSTTWRRSCARSRQTRSFSPATRSTRTRRR